MADDDVEFTTIIEGLIMKSGEKGALSVQARAGYLAVATAVALCIPSVALSQSKKSGSGEEYSTPVPRRTLGGEGVPCYGSPDCPYKRKGTLKPVEEENEHNGQVTPKQNREKPPASHK